jgi:serine/threonine-protein kinase
VMAHLLEPPPDPCKLAPDLPHGVCAALRKAMAKKPEERFESAGEMIAALQATQSPV